MCIEKEEEKEQDKIKENNRKIMIEYQKKQEERRIENERKQQERLKEAQRLDSIVQFKKDRIIRKRGFFYKDYNYTAQCKKCNLMYDYFKSENNECLCLSCFRK